MESARSAHGHICRAHSPDQSAITLLISGFPGFVFVPCAFARPVCNYERRANHGRGASSVPRAFARPICNHGLAVGAPPGKILCRAHSRDQSAIIRGKRPQCPRPYVSRAFARPVCNHGMVEQFTPFQVACRAHSHDQSAVTQRFFCGSHPGDGAVRIRTTSLQSPTYCRGCRNHL